ncbi:efflux RND transporter periplasmic adaptor subunit [Aneurinibacillus uraniidurans]|uniref:efflux RND transporter periplasmic adaptor subunit n=1 Tax=Aneurinibacillus uraniidurans TaxID=2966586 RepID=UPI00234A9D23|nr:efflux RND transporter periplasmic adaptor subunit [Aneurinibacillus sp. B1]WCN37480.1 efflux RND transporter periplasmic adaptor subunit [Aneurinibacillus sp. B1]
MRKKIIIGTIVLVLGAGGVAGYAALGNKQPKGVPVTLGAVVQKDMENKIMTTGRVKMKQEMTVYAGASGRITSLAVEEGTVVKKGQVVGMIDTQDIENQLLDMDSQLLDAAGQIVEIDAQIKQKQAEIAKLKANTEPLEISKASVVVKQTEQDYAGAKREYERIKLLVEQGVEKKQELDKATDRLDESRLKVQTARYELQLKQKGPKPEDVNTAYTELSALQVKKQNAIAKKGSVERKRTNLEAQKAQTVITAPMDGTIITRKAKQGEQATKGGELFTIGSAGALYIEADINEADSSKINIGQAAIIEGNALGKKKVNARITSVSPVAVTTQEKSQGQQEEKAKLTAKLELIEPVPALRAGFRVDVTIVYESRKQAVQVPIEAIQKSDNDSKSFVWVNENGRAKKKVVVTGMENELFAEVKQGLRAGDQIITNPGPQLKEQEPIIESVPESPGLK